MKQLTSKCIWTKAERGVSLSVYTVSTQGSEKRYYYKQHRGQVVVLICIDVRHSIEKKCIRVCN